MYSPPPAAPVPPPRPKRPVGKMVGFGCLGLVGLFILLAVIGAIAGTNTKTTPADPPTATESSHSATANKAPAPTHTAKPKPRVVLREHGNGTKSTATFTVRNDWDLRYTFNCANFGGEGNFMVDGSNGEGYVNSLAARGSDVTHIHGGDGKMSLTIDSECNWRITVVQLP